MSNFLNKKLESQFLQDGYVIVPFLNEQQVHDLRELYRKVQPISFPGFSSTIYSKDLNKKANTSKKVLDIVNENINQYIGNYRLLGASFLCKTPGNQSEMPIHQDWTIVDENKYFSATIWVPLQDVDVENGALMVIPGSHQFSKGVRGPSIPPLVDPVMDKLKSRMKTIPLKAGQAVVFNHALMHASPPNLSKTERWALTIGFTPKEAKLQFCHLEEGCLSRYEVKDDFFLTYNEIGKVPSESILIDKMNYTTESFSNNQLIDSLHQFDLQKSSNMKKLFTDPEKQTFFEKNGYVRFPLFDASEVERLMECYNQLSITDHSGSGFTMSMEGEDKEQVRIIRSKIIDIALPKAQPHFQDAKVITASFVIKENNPLGVVPPHQDWTFVNNEPEYNSVTCWVPLVPTTIENGCMGVIKGSHLLYDNYRPSPSPQVPTPLMNHLFSIFPYLEMIEMQPGEALVFDQRTFHASPPNVTDEPRVAVGIGFTQSEAELCHLTLKPNGKKDTLIKYKIDEEFLIKYDNKILSDLYENGQSIEGYEVLEEIPFVCPEETTDFLLQRIIAAGNVYNLSLANHMGKLFNNQMKSNETKSESQVPIEKTPFWKVYTPLNIVREIRFRLTGV
jgi:ectoine hydroxylase-related dioxygenase (phytanoyl-CoA dioxygenase family)